MLWKVCVKGQTRRIKEELNALGQLVLIQERRLALPEPQSLIACYLSATNYDKLDLLREKPHSSILDGTVAITDLLLPYSHY